VIFSCTPDVDTFKTIYTFKNYEYLSTWLKSTGCKISSKASRIPSVQRRAIFFWSLQKIFLVSYTFVVINISNYTALNFKKQFAATLKLKIVLFLFGDYFFEARNYNLSDLFKLKLKGHGIGFHIVANFSIFV